MGEADGEVRQPGRRPLGRQRVVEHDLSGDGATLGQRCVVNAIHPAVGPLCIFLLPLSQRVLPQGIRVIGPTGWHGWVARRCGQRVEFSLSGGFELVQRVDVNKDGADDLGPFLAGGNLSARAVVVAAVPVVEDDRLGIAVVAEVGVEVDAGRATAEVLDGGVNEPRANMVLRTGPAVGLGLVLHAGVAVFVLDGVLVDALAHDALLFGVDDHSGAPVRGRGLEHVAVLVHGDPVECLVETGDVAVLRAYSGGGVGGGMREDGVDVDATVSAAQ